jgi:hypothetical protein
MPEHLFRQPGNGRQTIYSSLTLDSIAAETGQIAPIDYFDALALLRVSLPAGAPALAAATR